MAVAFLKRPRFGHLGAAVLVSAALGGCLFDDALVELDPVLLLEDGTLDTLDASESFQVERLHLLESFGAYACPSCPDAEVRLSAYLHAAPGTAKYSPDLVVVNYHVAFPSTFTDPWITPATQARHDQFGFTGLPQVKLNGSNNPYGIREKDVRYLQGEYDTLIQRRHRVQSQVWLDLQVDTSFYDSNSRRLNLKFTVLNRSTSPQGALTFRALAVKNLSVTTTVPQNHPWDVIVAETTDRDSSGSTMTIAGLPGLRSRSYIATMAIPPESERSPVPPVIENPAQYAIVVFARNPQGIVENVAIRAYSPE